jgi:putative IMPACT (imprinted ancient) family translation regulator
LGVGGLVTAYRSAARLALENASLVEKMILETLSLRVDYANMDKVMRIIKENSLSILDQKLELDCFFKVSVRKSKLDQMIKVFKELRIVEVKRVN